MPDASISVSALEQKPNLIREPFDLAIFYQTGEVLSNTTIISRDAIFPVASPAVARRVHALSDLKNEVFLHDLTWKDDWKTWLSEIASHENLNKSGPEFTLYSLALEECKNGAGILIGHENLVRKQIDAGSLVAVCYEKVYLPRNLTITTMKPLQKNSILHTVVEKLLAIN